MLFVVAEIFVGAPGALGYVAARIPGEASESAPSPRALTAATLNWYT